MIMGIAQQLSLTRQGDVLGLVGIDAGTQRIDLDALVASEHICLSEPAFPV